MNRLCIRETGTQINTIRGWRLMLVLPPSMLDQPFRSTDVRNQMRWPHNGLACGGEGLGPKQGEFLEKVNPLVDRIVGETPFKELFP